MRVCGSLAMARSAGGVVLWAQKTEKFSMPRSYASRMVAAIAGMVVSKHAHKDDLQVRLCLGELHGV